MFKIPILYNSKVAKVKKHVIDDLELSSTNITDLSVYHKLIYDHSCTLSSPSYTVMCQMGEHYTTDVDFLKDTQQLIASISPLHLNTLKNKAMPPTMEVDEFRKEWQSFTSDYCDGSFVFFKEKYGFFEYEFMEHLNHNSNVMQLMSIAHIVSPIITLAFPILMLVFPLFVLRCKGVTCSWSEYSGLLNKLMSHHPLLS